MASATSDHRGDSPASDSIPSLPASDWNRTVDLLNFIFSPLDGRQSSPRSFGRFLLRRVLGRGGFGRVYLVEDPQNSGKFALKIANETTLESPTRVERFLSEGKRLVGLDHPNLATMHEFGEVDGIGYLRSHFCDGPNLRAWLAARETLPDPRCAAEWVAQLAEAVEYCHSKGIVHRDLKPSNVLFETRSAVADNDAADRWRLRIADFGLAHFLGDSDRTRTGDVVGTPGYLSPEQAEGSKSIGPATDVWGLGAILYELLTGAPAFTGRNDLEKLRRLLEAAPIPPRRLNPFVPASLEAICLRCLEFNPRLRYESAAALRDDLRRFLEGDAVRARSNGVIGRAVRWSTRRPGQAAAVAIALLGMVFLATGIAIARRKVDRAYQLAERETVERQLQDQRLQRTEFFNRSQAAYRNLLVGQPNSAFELLGDAARFSDTFEYRHLKWLATGCGRATELPERHGRVYSVAFSPDAKLFATANADRIGCLWEVAGPKLRALLRGHTDEVNTVAFATDGKRIATGGDDGMVMVWDASTGQKLSVVKAHEQAAISECLFLDNDRLLALSRDHRLTCLCADGLKTIWTIVGKDHLPVGHKNWTTALALTPDRRFAAVADSDAIVLYEMASRRMVSIMRAAPSTDWDSRKGYQKLGFIDDGKRLLAAADSLHVFDRLTGSEEAPIPLHKAIPTTLSYSNDARKLLMGRYHGSAELWDIAERSRMDLLSYHNDRIWDVAIAADGKRAVSGGNDGKTVLWDLSEPIFNGCAVLADDFPGLVQIAIDASEGSLVAVSSFGEIGLFDLRGRQRIRSAKLDLLEKYSLDHESALSRDGKLFAAIGESHLCVYETSGGSRLWQWPLSGEKTTIAFSGDSQKLFVLSAKKAIGEQGETLTMRACHSRSGKPAIAARSVNRWFRFAVSKTGDKLFGISNGSLTEYSMGDQVWQIPAEALRNERIPIFSPDESKIVAARSFPTVCVFDVASRACIAALKGNDPNVDLAAFSHDGKWLATSEREGGAVQLWDLELKSKTMTLESGLKSVEQILFVADGTALVAVGQNRQGRIRIFTWPAPKSVP